MQCPKCSSLCMDTDRSCPRCGSALGGLTPARVANWTALVFALLMIVFLVTVAIPRTQGPQSHSFRSILVDNIATNVANYVFIGGALIAGWVIGWVVGALFCRAR